MSFGNNHVCHLGSRQQSCYWAEDNNNFTIICSDIIYINPKLAVLHIDYWSLGLFMHSGFSLQLLWLLYNFGRKKLKFKQSATICKQSHAYSNMFHNVLNLVVILVPVTCGMTDRCFWSHALSLRLKLTVLCLFLLRQPRRAASSATLCFVFYCAT